MSPVTTQQLENNPKFTPGDDSLHITEQEGSWFGKSCLKCFNLIIVKLVASIFVIGCLTGSLVGGYQCDFLGRKISREIFLRDFNNQKLCSLRYDCRQSLHDCRLSPDWFRYQL